MQTKPIGKTAKEAADSAGKKKKKAAKKPKSRICKRQGKKTSLCLGSGAIASWEVEGDGEDTNDSVEEEMLMKALKDITNTTSPPMNSEDMLSASLSPLSPVPSLNNMCT